MYPKLRLIPLYSKKIRAIVLECIQLPQFWVQLHMYVCSQAIVVPKGIFVPKIEANIFNTHLCEKVQAIVVPKIAAIPLYSKKNQGYCLRV